jgi:dihydroorotase-like cyclic amidohydrolase
VVAPPLRSRETVQRLWDVLNEGLIDTIATDHAPGTPEERALGQKNIFKAGGGLPALETVWPTLMNEVNKGRLTLEKLVFLLAENPARVARLYPRKGCLSPGSDADIVLMDQHEVHRLRAGEMYTKHTDAATIFDGMEVKGRVKAVLQRGRVISRDGRLVSDRPSPAMWIRS